MTTTNHYRITLKDFDKITPQWVKQQHYDYLFTCDDFYKKFYEEVMSWLGTPYKKMWHHKQLGCDCNTFIGGVLLNLNILTALNIEYYPIDWYEDSQYDDIILFYSYKHLQLIQDGYFSIFLPADSPLLRGDILHFSLLSKKEILNHSAFLLENNELIHSLPSSGVTTDELTPALKSKLKLIQRIVKRKLI